MLFLITLIYIRVIKKNIKEKWGPLYLFSKMDFKFEQLQEPSTPRPE